MTNLLQTPRPAGGFKVILADPPWGFLSHSNKRTTPHRTATDHYETMTYEELCVLPVSHMAGKDCVLFMWTVSSHLEEALALGKRWGFSYKSIAFIWVKVCLPKKKQPAGLAASLAALGWYVIRPLMGMGFWTRQEAEVCLLFTRGKPSRISKGVRQVILDTRREHSRKPDETYRRIERLCGPLPRLELFARASWAGWVAWGNETEKFEALPEGIQHHSLCSVTTKKDGFCDYDCARDGYK